MCLDQGSNPCSSTIIKATAEVAFFVSFREAGVLSDNHLFFYGDPAFRSNFPVCSEKCAFRAAGVEPGRALVSCDSILLVGQNDQPHTCRWLHVKSGGASSD